MRAPYPDHLRLILVIYWKVLVIFIKNHRIARFRKALEFVVDSYLAGVGIADLDGSDQRLAIRRCQRWRGVEVGIVRLAESILIFFPLFLSKIVRHAKTVDEDSPEGNLDAPQVSSTTISVPRHFIQVAGP